MPCQQRTVGVPGGVERCCGLKSDSQSQNWRVLGLYEGRGSPRLAAGSGPCLDRAEAGCGVHGRVR